MCNNLLDCYSLGKDARIFAVVNTAGLFYVNGTLYYYDGNGNRQKVSLKEGWNKLPNGDYCYLKNGKLQLLSMERHTVLIMQPV